MKELSALFLSPERFQTSLQEVAQGRVESVRLFHNEPAHTARLLAALAHPQCQVHSLDIYSLDASPDSMGALQQYLSSPHVCRIHSLTVHSCQGVTTAAALGAGLGAGCCTVQQLSLTGLSDAELSAVLTPVARQQEQQGNGAAGRAHVLTRLSLTRCHLGSATTSWVRACTHLQELHMTECVMPDVVAEQLLHQAWLCSAAAGQLQVLSLCGTQVGVQAATAMSQLLAHPTGSQLSTLRLNNSTAFNDQAACTLSKGVHASKCIKQLQLCQCAVGPAGAQALAAALASHPSVEELNLDNNRIGAQGMMALLQAACGSHSLGQDVASTSASTTGGLHILRMESNGIKGSELPADWPVVSADTTQQQPPACALQVLTVAHNFLSDVGAQLLQQALAHAHQLTHLNLEGCGVGATGAAALVALLQQHPQLQELRLDHNRLHDAGGRLLLDAVQDHPGLHVFRADACRLLDVELKARLAGLTMQLAARASQQKQAGKSEQPSAVKVRAGTCFSPAVYQRHADMEHADMEHDSCGVGMSAAGIVTAPVLPQSPNAAAARVPRRVGTRFPPETYQQPMHMEDDEQHEAQQPSPAKGASTGNEQPVPIAGDKHLLGVEEREHDVRALKFKDAEEEADMKGGGSPGSTIPSGACSTPALHPFCDDAGKCWGRSSGEVPMGSYGMQSSWGHSSLSTCSRSSSQSMSPTVGAGCSMMHSHGSGSHSSHQGLYRMMSEGNHMTAHTQPLQSASSLPSNRIGHSQAQSNVFLVLRPSTNKKRCYKPLTAQQQALFDVF